MYSSISESVNVKDKDFRVVPCNMSMSSFSSSANHFGGVLDREKGCNIGQKQHCYYQLILYTGIYQTVMGQLCDRPGGGSSEKNCCW